MTVHGNLTAGPSCSHFYCNRHFKDTQRSPTTTCSVSSKVKLVKLTALWRASVSPVLVSGPGSVFCTYNNQVQSNHYLVTSNLIDWTESSQYFLLQYLIDLADTMPICKEAVSSLDLVRNWANIYCWSNMRGGGSNISSAMRFNTMLCYRTAPVVLKRRLTIFQRSVHITRGNNKPVNHTQCIGG